jgi:hypothetical protein
MLTGHVAAGLAAKTFVPRLSLGTLLLAALAADLLSGIFMAAGIEHMQFKSGMGAARYLDAFDIALSHSLLMDVVWAALFGAIWIFRRHDPRGAWVLGALVVSHWVLDWVSHKPDMPLAPGIHSYFGLGLWTSIPATIFVEGGFWIVAIIFYVRATYPVRRIGVYAFGVGIVVLTLAWYNNIAGPPPSNPRTAPIASLVFFSLVVAWGYWMDTVRGIRPSISRAFLFGRRSVRS